MNHILKNGTALHNGEYVIQNFISQGGFGLTYEAIWEKQMKYKTLKERVVIKELFIDGRNLREKENAVTTQSLSKEDFNHFKTRFIEEADTLAKFKHTGIVEVLDAFEENNTAYYVMEYIDGVTLESYLHSRKDGLPEHEVIDIAKQLLSALKEVHAHNIFHKDIKPQNIMRTAEGKITLIDFGSARQHALDTKTVTMTQIVTPGYASPEQYSSSQKIGASTDIYSLGATLLYCLTGKTPIAATDRIFDESKELENEIKKCVNKELQRILQKSLAIKSSDRYESAIEMLDDLQKISEEKIRTIDTETSHFIKNDVKNDNIQENNDNEGVIKGVGFLAIIIIIVMGIVYYLNVESVRTVEKDVEQVDEIRDIEEVDTIRDIDGNMYKTVKIGKQVWMAENLKTTKYNDGTNIPNVTDNNEWINLATGAYCNYDNDQSNVATYGRLYNWYAVNTGKLCPTGWHVPSIAEWTTLEDYLIANAYNYDGTTTNDKIAKAMASSSGWKSSTDEGVIGNKYYPDKQNASGFTALPGGGRYIDGGFYYIGGDGGWWSSTEFSTYYANYRPLYYYYGTLSYNCGGKEFGLSVRCVRDNEETVNGSEGSDKSQNQNNNNTINSTLSTESSIQPKDNNTVNQTAAKTIKQNQDNKQSTKISSITDSRDGIEYKTVKIGKQVWMAENLKATKYNDGTNIPNVTDNNEWSNLATGAYCNYDNDQSNVATYGRLYNWYAVNTGKLCPTGWHVPSDAEWTTLEDYLIANGYKYHGTTTNNKIAKAMASSSGWKSSTDEGVIGNNDYPEKQNASGFSALPGGYRNYNGYFYNIGINGLWWSATEDYTFNAWYRGMHYLGSNVYRNNLNKELGLSVRCVRD